MNTVTKIKTEDATPVRAETFAEAFLKLQSAIKPAIKDANNPAFRSKYADLGAVWEAIKQPLQDAGFSVIQSPDFEGDHMWLKTTILHVSGDKIEGRYPLRPSKPDPQGYGSALTYARRYSISAMLGVIADDDDDGNAASGLKTTVTGGNGGTPSKPTAQYPEDPDVTEGVKNWVNQQKHAIEKATRIPDLLMWLDEHGGDWAKPASPSALDRLKRKAPEAFEDLKKYYQAKQNFISKGRAST